MKKKRGAGFVYREHRVVECVNFDLKETLKNFGDEGYELASATQHCQHGPWTLIFKRVLVTP